MKHVYEVRETTDDEIYYPLGIYATLEQATETFTTEDSPSGLCHYGEADDYVKFEILKHELGKIYGGVTVRTIEYTQEAWDDENDKEGWAIKITDGAV